MVTLSKSILFHLPSTSGRGFEEKITPFAQRKQLYVVSLSICSLRYARMFLQAMWWDNGFRRGCLRASTDSIDELSECPCLQGRQGSSRRYHIKSRSALLDI